MPRVGHLARRHDVALDGAVQAIPATAFSTAAQMDDLHCFFHGFHTKRVADVQKLFKATLYSMLSFQG
jgi:hypothetical protein